MPSWMRFENWELAEPAFVELAVEGRALFVRSGQCKAGRPPKLVERGFDSDDAARAALAAEEKAWTKKKYVLEKTFEAPVPKSALAPSKKAPKRGRWSDAERAVERQRFFERVRAAGIDPDSAFASTSDGNARASTCVALAEEVLGVRFTRLYFGRDLTGEHDDFGEDDPQEVPFEAYARFYRSPAHVFAIAARPGFGTSTGRHDGEWKGTTRS